MNLAVGNSRRDARAFKPNFLSRVLLVHPTARLLGMSTRESFRNQSSLKRALINSSSSSMALSASGPSQRIRSLDPCPAASIIKPMMLLPFTSSPSFATQISERYRLAMRTNIAAGRAWRPSRFTIAISFSIFSPGAARLALRYNKPITSLLLLHQTDQFSVEVDGSVLTEALQLLIHRRDFDQTRHVATWPHRNRHMRHLKPKNFVKFPIKSDPIYRLDILPVLECHDKVEPLLDSNTADAENRNHVNDADPANFDVIASELRRRRHELAPFERSDPGDVISHEAVATLNQPEHAFTFADATRAAN